MSNKVYALATLAVVSSTFAMVGLSGCSSSSDDLPDTAPSADAGAESADAKLDHNTPDTSGGQTSTAEDGTVGVECQSNDDCSVIGTINDNVCSVGAFSVGDMYGSPVCIQTKCTIGSGGTFEDLLCDARAGLCLPSSKSSSSGTCLPLCIYTSTTIAQPCKGANKCQRAYNGQGSDGSAAAIGFCSWACSEDADCKGTPGEKCKADTGTCVKPETYVPPTKKVGELCSSTSTDCSCQTKTDATKGYCGHTCTTGATGNATCAKAAGDDDNWKCTTTLPTTMTSGGTSKPAFTGQPDGVLGTCALACPNGDSDCASLAATTGVALTCTEFADGKYCQLP